MVAGTLTPAAVRCVLDREARFTAVDPWLCDATGWSSEALLSRPLADWLHPDEREHVMAELRAPSPAAGAVPIEARFRQASGAYRWLTWLVWHDADAMQARVWDAGESMAAQERADELRRCYGAEWSVFFSDSQGCLVMPTTALQLLAEQDDLDAETRDIAEHALQAMLVLQDMRRDLYKVFAALGESRGDQCPISLPRLLDDVVTEVRAFYSKKRVELACHPADDLPPLLLARERSLRVAARYLVQTCAVLPERCRSSASLYPVSRVILAVGLEGGRLVLRATASGGDGPVPDLSSFQPDMVRAYILRQLGAEIHVEPRADGWTMWFAIEYVPTSQEPF